MPSSRLVCIRDAFPASRELFYRLSRVEDSNDVLWGFLLAGDDEIKVIFRVAFYVFLLGMKIERWNCFVT